MVLPSPRPQLKYTYREYALIPEDGLRHELIEGEFYVTPSPTPFHQTASRRLQFALMQQLEVTGIALIFNAPTDLILDDHTVVVPDLALVRSTRKQSISKRGIEAPPDVVVEILSPSTKGNDQFLKKAVYAKFNIPEYWIVDPDLGSVAVFRLVDGQYQLAKKFYRPDILESGEFPEVRIPLAPVFGPI